MGRTEKELNFQLQTQIEETNKLIQGVSLYYINWMQMTTNKYEWVANLARHLVSQLYITKQLHHSHKSTIDKFGFQSRNSMMNGVPNGMMTLSHFCIRYLAVVATLFGSTLKVIWTMPTFHTSSSVHNIPSSTNFIARTFCPNPIHWSRGGGEHRLSHTSQHRVSLLL